MLRRFSWASRSNIFEPPFEGELELLSLTNPATRPQVRVEGGERQSQRTTWSPTVFANAKKAWLPLSLWTFSVSFFALFSLYISQALVNPAPHLGKLLLSASNTNLLVSVLSQVFATLVNTLFTEALDSMRWQLAARTDGLAMPTFFELSSATSMIATLMFTVVSPLESLWGVVR
jgi:hypothetical protein